MARRIPLHLFPANLYLYLEHGMLFIAVCTRFGNGNKYTAMGKGRFVQHPVHVGRLLPEGSAVRHAAQAGRRNCHG